MTRADGTQNIRWFDRAATEHFQRLREAIFAVATEPSDASKRWLSISFHL